MWETIEKIAKIATLLGLCAGFIFWLNDYFTQNRAFQRALLDVYEDITEVDLKALERDAEDDAERAWAYRSRLNEGEELEAWEKNRYDRIQAQLERKNEDAEVVEQKLRWLKEAQRKFTEE